MPLRLWRGSSAPTHPAPLIWGAYPTLILGDVPVGYWRLGETSGTIALDNSGWGRDGTYQGGVTLNTGYGAIPTDQTTSVFFDGTSGDVQIPLPSLTDVSLEAWFYFVGLDPNGGLQYILSSPGTHRTYIGATYPGGNGGLTPSYGLNATGGFYATQGNNLITPGQWHHIVVTYSTSGGVGKHYLDGALSRTNLNPGGGSITGFGGTGFIGQSNASGNFFKGYIQDVAVYNYELSATQVLNHFNAGNPLRLPNADAYSIARDGEYRYRIVGPRRGKGYIFPQHPAPNIWGPYPTAVLADAPYRYFRLGELSGTKALDNSGRGSKASGGTNNPDANIVAGVTLNQPGAFATDTSRSALFDGVAGDITFDLANAGLNAANVTMEVWARPTAHFGGFTVHLLADGSGGNFIAINNDQAYYSTNLTVGGQKTFLGPPVSLNDWHHFVWTYDGTTITYYLDGAQVGSQAFASTTISGLSQNGFHIGNFSGVGSFYQGYAQDVAIYGSTLSPSRVLTHYQLGALVRAVPVTNTAITTGGERRFLILGQRRGRLILPPWPAQAPQAPNFVTWQQRKRRDYPSQRRRQNQPPIGHHAGPIPHRNVRAARILNVYLRGLRRVVAAPIFQAAENTNGYFLRRAFRLDLVAANRFWTRRGKSPLYIPGQEQPAPPRGQRRTQPPYVRKGKYWYATFPATVTPTGPNLVFRWGQRRTQPPYMRRGRVIWPIPPQANPLTNGYTLLHSSQRWMRADRAYLKRGRFVFASFPASISPTAPNLVFRWGQRRTQPPYTRRGHVAWPIPPQAPVNTNGYFIPHLSGRWTRDRRVWTKRGHLWLPTPEQNTVIRTSRSVRQIRPPYVRPQHSVEIPWLITTAPTAPNLVYRQGQRRTQPPYFKRGHLWLPTPPQAAENTNGYFLRRNFRSSVAANRQFIRRGRSITPIPAQIIVPNPSFVEWMGRRSTIRGWLRALHAKRQHSVEPYFILAYGPNPPTVQGALRTREVPIRWAAPRRGRSWPMPFGLTVAPIIISTPGQYFADESVTALYLIDEEVLALYQVSEEAIDSYGLDEEQF